MAHDHKFIRLRDKEILSYACMHITCPKEMPLVFLCCTKTIYQVHPICETKLWIVKFMTRDTSTISPQQ
jgi:hypothetical protein